MIARKVATNAATLPQPYRPPSVGVGYWTIGRGYLEIGWRDALRWLAFPALYQQPARDRVNGGLPLWLDMSGKRASRLPRSEARHVQPGHNFNHRGAGLGQATGCPVFGP